MKLNLEELIIASILTAIVVPFPIALLAIPACAFLWALSGSESKYNYKLWRRLGVPLVWVIGIFNYYALAAVPIAFGFLSMGYGLPSTQPPDEGSGLGRFFWNLTGGNVLFSNILTRGVIYLGTIIPFLVIRCI